MANEVEKRYNVSECVSDKAGVVLFVRKGGKYYCSDSFSEALKEIFNTRATIEYIDVDNNFKTVRVDASVDAENKVITLHIPAAFGSNDNALNLMYTIENEITAEEVAGGSGGGSAGGVFTVNITGDYPDNATSGEFVECTCDKTDAEIREAHANGCLIQFCFNGMYYTTPTSIEEAPFGFMVEGHYAMYGYPYIAVVALSVVNGEAGYTVKRYTYTSDGAN